MPKTKPLVSVPVRLGEPLTSFIVTLANETGTTPDDVASILFALAWRERPARVPVARKRSAKNK